MIKALGEDEGLEVGKHSRVDEAFMEGENLTQVEVGLAWLCFARTYPMCWAAKPPTEAFKSVPAITDVRSPIIGLGVFLGDEDFCHLPPRRPPVTLVVLMDVALAI